MSSTVAKQHTEQYSRLHIQVTTLGMLSPLPPSRIIWYRSWGGDSVLLGKWSVRRYTDLVLQTQVIYQVVSDKWNTISITCRSHRSSQIPHCSVRLCFVNSFSIYDGRRDITDMHPCPMSPTLAMPLISTNGLSGNQSISLLHRSV